MKTAREGKSASTSANHRKGELTRVSSYSDSDLVDFPPESWTIPQFFSTFVPEYKSKVYGPIIASLEWDVRYPAQILGISQKRADRRCDNYLSTDEIIRVKKKLQSKHEAAIRFGELKRGHGYKKERGDFCLVGGAIKETRKGPTLTVFYRSLELMGGFAFDLCLFARLGFLLDLPPWHKVKLFTCNAFTFALKGNSNEVLYPKLVRIFRSTE
jgi:hypothetical protein